MTEESWYCTLYRSPACRPLDWTRRDGTTLFPVRQTLLRELFMQHRVCTLAVFVVLGSIVSVKAENWPQFRGPTGQGHYAGKSLPSEWSATKNVVWKQRIPGNGWSSPVVQ